MAPAKKKAAKKRTASKASPKKQPAVKASTALVAMRRICLSLPDTTETLTWGQPHFRVADKIFSGCGDEKGRLTIGFKLEMEHAAAILSDPRFTRAPYVGRYGWVSMDASQVDDWKQVEMLVRESYSLIAPKASVAKLRRSQP